MSLTITVSVDDLDELDLLLTKITGASELLDDLCDDLPLPNNEKDFRWMSEAFCHRAVTRMDFITSGMSDAIGEANELLKKIRKGVQSNGQQKNAGDR